MASRIVQGVIKHLDDTPWPSIPIVFELLSGSYTGSATYLPDKKVATTNKQGFFSISLWVNSEGSLSSSYRCTLPSKETFTFTLPSGSTPIDIQFIRSGLTPIDPVQDATILAYVDNSITTHEAKPDPHPQYLTKAEGDGLYTPLGTRVEDVQDIIGSTLTSNSEISFTYTDASNQITANVVSVSDSAIPSTITRDTELTSGLATKSDVGHIHSDATSITSGFLSSVDKAKLDGIATRATANSTDIQLRDRSTHTGTQLASTISDFSTATQAVPLVDSQIPSVITRDTELTAGLATKSDITHSHEDATATTSGFLSSTDKTKLDGIQSGATANSADTFLLNRANHTGTQTWSTIVSTPTTLSGYGIADAATSAQGAKADSALQPSAIGTTVASYSDSRLTDQRTPLDGSVTDAKIGSRTVDPTLPTPSITGTFTQLLSWITGRIKAITGTTNWYDAPAITLASANTQISSNTANISTNTSAIASNTAAIAGKANSGANSDITSLTGLSTALSIGQGGTGGNTATSARSNLGLGSLATQNSSAISVTGGSLDGVSLGATTPGSVSGTTGTFSGALSSSTLSTSTSVAGLVRQTFRNADVSASRRSDIFIATGATTEGLYLGSQPSGAYIDNRSGASLFFQTSGTSFLSIDSSGNLVSTSTTGSTSSTQGAITTTGGLGVGGNINAGGTLHKFGGNSNTSSQISINAATSTTRALFWQTAGANRWSLYANGASAETGSNAGSPIYLSYYNDAGTYLGDIWAANRLGQFYVYTTSSFTNPTDSSSSITGGVTFSGGVGIAKSLYVGSAINSVGQRIGLAPTSAPAGGGFRYDYTAGASIPLVSVGPSSNIQFGHGASGVATSAIWNSGGSFALQYDVVGSANQGNVLIGTATNDGINKLQVAGSGIFSGALTASSYAKISGSGGSNSSAVDVQSSAYNNPHIVFLDSVNASANAPLKLVQSGLRTFNFLYSSGGLGALNFSNSSTGGFSANFQSNLSSVSLPLTLSNINAAIGYGTQFNFQLGDGTNLYNSGGIAYKQETLFTSTASTQNATVTLTSMTAGSATEKLRILSSGRVLIATTTDDGTNKLQVAGGASFASIAAQISYTVATLPPVAGFAASSMIWCSNGRKPGEAASAGTGVWVSPVGSNWCLFNSTTTVSA